MINESDGSLKNYPRKTPGYVYPVRFCIKKAIQRGIEKGTSDHMANTAIAAELINAGWKDKDVAFVIEKMKSVSATKV